MNREREGGAKSGKGKAKKKQKNREEQNDCQILSLFYDREGLVMSLVIEREFSARNAKGPTSLYMLIRS